MGCSASKDASKTPPIDTHSKHDKHLESRDSHADNIHPVNQDIKIHTVVSADLDFDHETAMKVKIISCTIF